MTFFLEREEDGRINICEMDEQVGIFNSIG
jgi:hypothetical protein